MCFLPKHVYSPSPVDPSHRCCGLPWYVSNRLDGSFLNDAEDGRTVTDDLWNGVGIFGPEVGDRLEGGIGFSPVPNRWWMIVQILRRNT